MGSNNYLNVRLSNAVDTSTGGTVLQVKDRKHDVHTIYSNRGVRTTVSSTRYDTAGRGINSIIFITDGALTSLTCTDMQLSTNISSGTTLTAGSIIYVNNASKVKCSSHGAQLIYFNS